MSHNHDSRRNFLKLFGTSTTLALYQSPIQILIEAIVQGAESQARADAAGLTPRRYLHIMQESAPARWTFDHFVTPYSKTGFVPNANQGTKVSNASSTTTAALSYETYTYNGMNLPWMWQYQVASPGGTWRPMTDLLANMVSIRGIQIGNPDHGAAQAMQFLPAGAIQSMTALSADASNNPIAAVNISAAQYRFLSTKSKSPVSINTSANGGNMLTTLTAPFNSSATGTFLTNRNKLGPALDAAIGAMNTASEALKPNLSTDSKANQAAKDLMSTGFGNLTTQWSTLNGKYQDLVSRSSNANARSLAGINDQFIKSDATGAYTLNGVAYASGVDVRTMFQAASGIYNLATHFAAAEYILTNNLSSSVCISTGYWYSLLQGGVSTYWGTDEHTTGGVISMLGNTFMNFAYAACLIELISVLKAKNMFNDTVITMGGEFGRVPIQDAAGSDHAYMGSSSNIYSGALTGPLVLGNIYNNKSQSNPTGTATYTDAGTWGLGAPVAQLGRALNLNDWASTVAYLLRVPSPSTAATSLLISDNKGGYTSLIEQAKQI